MVSRSHLPEQGRFCYTVHHDAKHEIWVRFFLKDVRLLTILFMRAKDRNNLFAGPDRSNIKPSHPHHRGGIAAGQDEMAVSLVDPDPLYVLYELSTLSLPGPLTIC